MLTVCIPFENARSQKVNAISSLNELARNMFTRNILPTEKNDWCSIGKPPPRCKRPSSGNGAGALAMRRVTSSPLMARTITARKGLVDLKS